MWLTDVAAYQNASDEERRKIAEADVLVSQVLDFVPRIGDLETRATVQLVPHVTAAFLWPHTGSPHPRNAPAPLLDASGPYPAEIGDSFPERGGTAEKVPADEAVARYLATDVAKVRKLDGSWSCSWTVSASATLPAVSTSPNS